MIAAVVRGLILLVSISYSVFGAGVSLQWDPSPDVGLAKYVVYRGTMSGVYDWAMDVPITSTNGAVTDLVDGQTYFFAVTVVDTNNVPSDFSNKISSPPLSAIVSNSAPVATDFTVAATEDQTISF